MRRSLSMRGLHRTVRTHGLGRSLVCLACVLGPSVAMGQALSAGNIAASTVPTMPAPAAGGAGQAGGAGTGSLFDNFNAFIDVNERYSTNANGSAVAGESDWDSRFDLGLNASKSTRRINLSVGYMGSLDYFARESSDVTITNNLNANATVDVIEDHVLVQATAFASPVYVTRLGNVAPAGQALPPGFNGDLQNSYGFNIQPVITFRLGDFLTSQTMPAYSAYFYDQQNGGAAVPLGEPIPDFLNVRSIQQRLTTGNYFDRAQLGITGSYSELDEGSGGLIQKSVMGELTYAIDHGISLVGDAGYQTVQANVAFKNPLNGPIFMAGLNFDLARLTGQVRAGEQYHSFSGTGNINYQITPRLSLTATAQDGVNAPGANLFTPGSLLSGLLNAISTGQLQIPTSGILNLNDILGAIGLNNSIARFRFENVALNFAADEFNLSVGGYNSSQDTQTAVTPGQNGNLETIGGFASITHQFSNDLSGSFTSTYHQDTLQYGNASDVEFSIGATYALARTMQLYGEFDYFDRLSNNALAAASADAGSLSMVSVSLGLRYQL